MLPLMYQVAFMFNEWYKPNSCLDFPVGGSQAMVDALVRWALTLYTGMLILTCKKFKRQS